MKLFRALRVALLEADVRQCDVAKRLDMTPESFSQRMTAKVDFKLEEMYIIMEMLELPQDKLSYYFPRGGKSEKFFYGRTI